MKKYLEYDNFKIQLAHPSILKGHIIIVNFM
jgi:hypothetical protein